MKTKIVIFATMGALIATSALAHGFGGGFSGGHMGGFGGGHMGGFGGRMGGFGGGHGFYGGGGRGFYGRQYGSYAGHHGYYGRQGWNQWNRGNHWNHWNNWNWNGYYGGGGGYPGYYSSYGYPYGDYCGSYYGVREYGNGCSSDSKVTELQRRLSGLAITTVLSMEQWVLKRDEQWVLTSAIVGTEFVC